MWIVFVFYMRWCKNVARREEITMLMQGLELLNPRPCATFTLLPVMKWPISPPPLPVEPFKFYEPVDTYGQAQVWKRGNNSTVFPDIPVPTTTALPHAHKQFLSQQCLPPHHGQCLLSLLQYLTSLQSCCQQQKWLLLIYQG